MSSLHIEPRNAIEFDIYQPFVNGYGLIHWQMKRLASGALTWNKSFHVAAPDQPLSGKIIDSDAGYAIAYMPEGYTAAVVGNRHLYEGIHTVALENELGEPVSWEAGFTCQTLRISQQGDLYHPATENLAHAHLHRVMIVDSRRPFVEERLTIKWATDHNTLLYWYGGHVSLNHATHIWAEGDYLNGVQAVQTGLPNVEAFAPRCAGVIWGSKNYGVRCVSQSNNFSLGINNGKLYPRPLATQQTRHSGQVDHAAWSWSHFISSNGEAFFT